MPNLLTAAGVFNVLKNPAAGLFRLSAIFNTKRLRGACAHDTYHWPKQFLPWIQMSRFSGDDKIVNRQCSFSFGKTFETKQNMTYRTELQRNLCGLLKVPDT